MMYKVINPFTANINHQTSNVFIEIKIQEKDKGPVLSMMGVEGPFWNGDCRGGCGQINMHMDNEYLSQIRFREGWNQEMVNTLLSIWDKWHLNDMRAGCIHQRNAGPTSRDMIGNECPTCGYRYGSAWLYESIPNDVLETLVNFPETDKQYPWAH